MTAADILNVDSATKFTDDHRGMVVICGSHGGTYPAFLAAKAGLRAVILNDAGIGLERAGLGCLDYCQELGMAAANCSHDTARIGDATDMAARGRISHVNEIADGLGCAAGQPVTEAAMRLLAGPYLDWNVPAYEEERLVVGDEDNRQSRGSAPRIVCLDSVSLVTGDDVGQIVLTGSHGGLMGGKPELALKVDALAAFFNDAGIGIDEAGLGRLAALQTRGIAGATVAAMTARIGDGRSTYEDGIVSRVNQRAKTFGILPGITAKEAVERLQEACRIGPKGS